MAGGATRKTAGWKAAERRVAELEAEVALLNKRHALEGTEAGDPGSLAELDQANAGLRSMSTDPLDLMVTRLDDVPACRPEYILVGDPTDDSPHRVGPRQVQFLWMAYANLRTFVKTMVATGEATEGDETSLQTFVVGWTGAGQRVLEQLETELVAMDELSTIYTDELLDGTTSLAGSRN